MKQVISPQFTAKAIFKLEDNKSYSLIHELGFANMFWIMWHFVVDIHKILYNCTIH